MTTVTVELPFALAREHMLVLKAIEMQHPITYDHETVQLLPDQPTRDLFNHYAFLTGWGEPFLALTYIGRAILEQCPLLWEPADLEAKLREMAGDLLPTLPEQAARLLAELPLPVGDLDLEQHERPAAEVGPGVGS